MCIRDRHYFAYLMEYSCLKTLAGKHKSKISKIKRKYRDGQGNWSIPYETRKGVRRMSFAKYQESKKMKAAQDKLPNAAVKAIDVYKRQPGTGSMCFWSNAWA